MSKRWTPEEKNDSLIKTKTCRLNQRRGRQEQEPESLPPKGKMDVEKMKKIKQQQIGIVTY